MPAIPLSDVADDWIGSLAAETGSHGIARLSGAGLLGERAASAGFAIPGLVSAGGGCRLLATRDGMIALNLARPDDLALMPAWLELDAVADPAALATAIAARPAAALVARGREMGLAVAAEDGEPVRGPVHRLMTRGRTPPAPAHRPPRVLDLSALWAGPLASHLLGLAGAEVIKVESRRRPDAMRQGDRAMFALLNQGKASIAVDLACADDRRALTTLIARCDIVIEAARPRALAQCALDAAAAVRDRPGLVWMTITAHGAEGEPAEWIGFGDDIGVAAGLSAALRRASGRSGFVGDAIADPLTGIFAAQVAWAAWRSGRAGRHGLSMRAVVAQAMAEACGRDPSGFEADLRAWRLAEGEPFPPVARRRAGPVRAFGCDSAAWLAESNAC